STIGIFAGIYLNKFINEKQLKIGFGYFVLIMACVILIKEIFFV
ncbi:MAG TPA: permease, partial [Flavobacterium sp.]|nr:permease [Flavobacterium sp.]